MGKKKKNCCICIAMVLPSLNEDEGKYENATVLSWSIEVLCGYIPYPDIPNVYIRI
jgi:hypothetical protein